MNKFDEKYEFRMANVSDIESIMQYIDNEWKKGHILAVNRDFFESEFRDGKTINFILAIDKKSGAIEGLVGFYPASKDQEHLDIWGANWSVRKDGDNYPFLGVELLRRLEKITQYRSEIGVGVDAKTALPLQDKILRHKTGKLDHFYLLNQLSEYKIASITDNTFEKKSNQVSKSYIKKVENICQLEQIYDFSGNKDKIPYKDSWYINKRFFKHPIYKYQVYAIMEEENKAEAIMILREVRVGDRKVLRIVDYIGNIQVIAGIKYDLKKLMDEGCEYIDFYCYGFEKKYIEAAGFILKTEKSNNIIPNYFEPFFKKNIEIWFNSTVNDNFVICKADADQDRPNISNSSL